MNRAILTLCFLTGLAFSGWSAAQDDIATYDRYETNRKFAGRLFVAAYANFGYRLRAAATLQACNRNGIANAIDVEAAEGAAFLVEEMQRLRASDSKYAIPLDTLSTAESINLISRVNDQLNAYKLGYREAVSLVRDGLPAICEAGMQSAEKILKERN